MTGAIDRPSLWDDAPSKSPPCREGGLSARRLVALAAFLLILDSLPTGARTGPDGRIRAICLGDVIAQFGTYNSFTVIRHDPAIRVTLIPSRAEQLGGYENAYRNVRQYMPRTYEQFIQNCDIMVVSDADRLVFKPEWISWMSDSVAKGGLGLLFLGSIMSEVFVGWEGTTLSEVLPVVQAPGQYTRESTFWLKVEDPQEPLMVALPWDRSPPLANVNAQVPKEASSLWATAEAFIESHPLMTFWEIGDGAALAFSSKFPAGVLPWAEGWNLFPQAMIYMVYRVGDKVLPDDPYLFESVTNAFPRFTAMNSLLDSMLVWVERFGASPGRLRDQLLELVDTRKRAEAAYLDGEFALAMDILAEAEGEQTLLRQAAMKAKDEALFWIYLTEWCALLGTLMISGYVLWALMVGRRLYREVGSSRLEIRVK